MTPSAPFFSIIVPTYNRGAFILRTLQSIIDQTFEDFEIIVVDDGSTDNTRDLVNGLADRRIRYFFKQNEERSIARNFGISKSAGAYINFFDSDDYCHKHHLQAAFGLLNDKSFPELLHLSYELRSVDGAIGFPLKVFKRGRINRDLIFDNVLYGGCFFIQRKILDEIRFIDHKDASFSEDWYLWLRLAARYPIHVSDIVTVVVTDHDERSLRTIVPENLERSLVKVVEELKKDKVFLEYYKRSFNYFIAECFSLIGLHYAERNREKAFRYLVRSMVVHPLIVKRKRFWALLRNLTLGQRRTAI